MDPRHPEQAISRMRELMKQYDRIENDMAKATTSAKLAELEREGGLVIQEICLVAPRIHEAMMQTSRQRRHDLAKGILIEPQDTAVELPKLTPEKEEDFARLLVILDNAKKQFEGKDARDKKTGEVYSNLFFTTIKPFESDSHKYGVSVSMDNDKEILFFFNEEVVDFLNGYEPVEKTVEKPQEKCVNDAPKQPEKCDETEAEPADVDKMSTVEDSATQEKKVTVSKLETPTKKTTKKKTTKKAKK